jgi:hypothetical protein
MKNTALKIKIATTFSLGLILLTTGSAKAQTVLPLTVAPSRQTITVNPGDTETVNIKFISQSTSPVTGNIKAVDFIVTDNSGVPTLLEEASPFSTRYAASQWVNMPFDKASISAEGILNIQAKISVPADARPGGRYLAVYFEPTGTLGQFIGSEKEGTQAVSSRLVGLVYIRVSGPITESALISSFEAPRLVEFGPIKASAAISNKGDYHITPKGQLTLTDFMGRKVSQVVLDEKNVFPDNSRVYNMEIGPKLLIGKFKLNLVAAYGESGQVVSATKYVWAFPWKLALVIILTITILILFGRYISQSIKGKQKKLEQTLESEIAAVEELKEKYQDAVTNLPETEEKKEDKKE